MKFVTENEVEQPKTENQILMKETTPTPPEIEFTLEPHAFPENIFDVEAALSADAKDKYSNVVVKIRVVKYLWLQKFNRIACCIPW